MVNKILETKFLKNKCEYCNGKRQNFHKRFCSIECRTNFIKDKRHKVNCETCKKVLFISKSILNRHKNHFCSVRCSSEWRKDKSFETGRKNAEHWNWKGDKAKYQAIHIWVRRNKPKPKLCVLCGKRKARDLANISGDYRRDINDYQYLCRKCHIRFDKKIKAINFTNDKIISITSKSCNKEMFDIETKTHNFIANGIVTHNCKQSKKGRVNGYWLPSVEKEKVEVCVVVDTSGSVNKKDLVDFMSEVVGIARAYQNAITIRFITHDTKVQNDLECRNGNIDKILKTSIKGNGGTNFNCVFEYIKEKRINPKVVIFLTDGENGERVSKQSYPILWCLSGSQTTDYYIKGSGVIIKLKDDGD